MNVRLAEPRDIPALLKKHREQNERDGTKYPLPKIFDDHGALMPNIDVALVIEDDDGEVMQGVVFEHITEMQCFGCDPRATAFGRRELESVEYLLRSRGIKVETCVVPKALADQIGKPLGRVGFRRNDNQFAYFVKELK